MMTTIPYARQNIDKNDIQAVIEVLESDLITQGPVVPKFETAVANYCGTRYAVAVNSATSALHIACLALGVGQGDRVWTTPITFVASANCVLYCGAKVDFVDIDSRTYNLSVPRLAEKLAQAEKIGQLPKVVIAVHMCGQPCDLAAICALGRRYGFKIIEDAAHAIGGRYQNEPIGNCRHSDISVFSFHPAKIITTGEGGMAMSNEARLARRLRLLRSHGITSEVAEMRPQTPKEIWNYQQIDLGFNYRMTDILAALGLSQLQRLDQFIVKRHIIAKRYEQMLSKLPVLVPYQHAEGYSSFHLYVIRLALDKIHRTHRQVYESLRAAGILVNLHYIPVYRQPYYADLGFKAGYCPQAERHYAEAISIPIYPDLTEEQQNRVVTALKRAISR